jgi:serine/threonine protein kinase/tetratricopeptide (TPR) repeat protein
VQNKVHDDDLVMSIVELALACPPEERERYLHSACARDSGLFEEVWKYVLAEQRMNGFLLEPLFPPADQRAFKPGEVIEDRFRILREVAEGGMGVVYEARDEKLDRRIAIKCAKPGFRKRLPPEVRNAREITHPNVCKIFEIHTAATDRGEVDFITMEFLDGETLAERLRRGPLPETEARTMALQLCAGLAEAHRNQVIHGDLKSNNVILTKAAGGATRVVITDFGLARRPETTQQTIQSGVMGGTPDYMAPELWRGEKASVASDIYALGVILYEMVSGRRPYRTATPSEATDTLPLKPQDPQVRQPYGTATSCDETDTLPPQLQHSPAPRPHETEASWEDRLKRKPAAVHRKWDHILVRCLEPEPGRRFRSVEEVARTLEPSHSGRWWLAAAAAAALVIASVLVTYEKATPPRESVQLAMLPLEFDAGTAALAASLSRDMSSQLAHLSGAGRVKLTIVPLDNALRAKVDSTEKARTSLGATHVLHGTLAKDHDKIVLRAYLTDARNSGKQTDWKVEYAPGEVRYAPVALAGFVAGTLRLSPLAINATLNPAAKRDYWDGVWYTRQNSTLDAALRVLEQAVAEDRDSPLTWAALAEADWFQYYLSQSQVWLDSTKDSLRQAEARNPDIAAAHRVEGYLLYHEGLYEQAVAEFDRAIELQPGNAMAFIYEGKAYQDNGQLPQSRTAFENAVKAEPNYFRTWQNLGSFYLWSGEISQALAYHKKSVELAPQEPNLHWNLAVAYMESGKFDEALQEITGQESVSALTTSGMTLMYQGKYPQAALYLMRALELKSPPGGVRPYSPLMYLGIAYHHLNMPALADMVNRRGLQMADDDMTKAGNARDGYVEAYQGYFGAALGDPRAETQVHQALGLMPHNLDTRWRAVLSYEELFRRSGNAAFRDKTLEVLRGDTSEEIADVNRWDDLADLRNDSRFTQLVVHH